jgi:ATP-dependent helicase Lhr and Lhr-like helicase
VNPPTDKLLLAALWDLVWSGEVTNDTVMPLRMRLQRASRTRRPFATRGGPAEGAGRWSLVHAPAEAPITERLHALALSLLERHGVLTREAVLAEGVAGGFAGVYPILKAMEEAGTLRRGYFVEGLGAAQFALPGAVDRLRSEREPAEGVPITRVLAVADPANPYGASLAWPRTEAPQDASAGRARSPQRVAGAYLVMVDGEPAVYLERGGKALLTLLAFERDEVAAAAVQGLVQLTDNLPRRELTIERVDGEPVLSSSARHALEQAGFRREYLGLTRRAQPPSLERRLA